MADQDYYSQMPQLPQMPDPNAAFNNLTYANNNAMLMNSGQANVQMAMQTAQANFAQHMQDVLQGTMASAMAIYNVGKSAHEKSRETVYQDQLIGNGIYALERSTWRDITWGIGLAGSDLGRELKIGGRRPEFMTAGEYTFQMNRSFNYRTQEMKDALLSGSLSAGASIIGMTMGPAGMLAGAAFGYALDQTVGKMAQPYLERRAAVREMREFTDMVDMGQGVGQRRMSGETSERLANEFFNHDVSALKYIPVIGDAIAGRFGPEVKYKDTFKKMTQQNLFTDLNPDDVDKIADRVKQTAVIMDKFAGLLNTTRDSIIQMKGRFNAIGMSDIEQNAALGNLARFTNSTGLSIDAGLAYRDNFIGIGKAGNFFNTGSAGMQGSYGLNEIASIKSLQNSGLISKSYDAGTLGMQFYSNAVSQSNTAWGKVAQFGNGSITQTSEYYASRGNGSQALGMELESLAMFGKTGNPLDEYAKSQDLMVDKLRKSGMTEQNILAFLLNRENTKEGKEQAFYNYSGMRGLGMSGADLSDINRRLEKTGQKVNSYKLGDLQSLSNINLTGLGSINEFSMERAGRSRRTQQEAFLATEINKESGDLYYGYNNALRDQDVVKQLQYNLNMTGAYGLENSDQEKDIVKLLREKGYVKNDEQAKQVINNYNRKFGEDVFKKGETLGNDIGGALRYLEKYKNSTRTTLSSGEQKIYNNVLSNYYKKHNLNEVLDVQKQLGLAKTPEAKEKILRTHGLAINDIDMHVDEHTGQTVYNDTGNFNLSKSLQLMQDVEGGLRGFNNDNRAKLTSLLKNFGDFKADKKNDAVLQALGIKTSDDYYNKLSSAGQDLAKTFRGKINKNDVARLAPELSLITSSDEDTGKKLANFLATASEPIKEKFFENLQNQNFAALKSFGDDIKNDKDPLRDDATKALEDFTKVLDKLSSALGGK